MLSPIQKHIVNDIDLDRLQQLVDEASVNPALGFEVTTRWNGQFRSETKVGAIRMGNGDLVVRDRQLAALAQERAWIWNYDAETEASTIVASF